MVYVVSKLIKKFEPDLEIDCENTLCATIEKAEEIARNYIKEACEEIQNLSSEEALRKANACDCSCISIGDSNDTNFIHVSIGQQEILS